MFRMMFGLTPRWVKKVEKEGKTATAVVKTTPSDVLKGVRSYSGADGWVNIEVVVHPRDDIQYDGKMLARYSQTVFGMIAAGAEVAVKYDPHHKDRILLVDDVTTLIRKQYAIDR